MSILPEVDKLGLGAISFAGAGGNRYPSDATSKP